MKRIVFFLLPILVFLIPFRVKPQGNLPTLDQVKLFRQLIGTWQRAGKTDTVAYYEIREFGNAFRQTNYRTIKGVTHLDILYSYRFSPQEGKFRLFGHTPDGAELSFLAWFVTENRILLERNKDFETLKPIHRNDVTLTSPTKLHVISYNREGGKMAETDWLKIK